MPDASEYIYVTYTNASGTETVLSSSQYSITINSVATGQIWASGFTLTYPTFGAPIANGTSLTVQRILPLQQLTSLENQGNFYPQAVEAGLDVLEMQIQQVSARTGSYRGVWATNVIYNFGDIVQDGINGAYTNNLYVCAIANTSGTWATDLASGDWSLALNIQTINASGTYLPLAGGTISGNLGVTGTTTLSGNATVGGTLGVTGAATLSSTLGVTGATTLSSTLGVTGAATLSGGGTTPTLTAGSNSTGLATTAYADQTNFLGSASNLKSNVTTAGSSATFTADEIVLGVALGGSGIKIGSYSKTVNLSTTGAGGMDTGTAPVSGFVSIYAIQGTSGTSILACNVTTSSGTIYSGANMPTGYTKSALLGIRPTNGLSQFIIGYLVGRQFFYNQSGNNVLSGGSATSYTSVNLATYVPPSATSVLCVAITSTNSGQQLNVSPFSSANQAIIIGGTSGTSTGFFFSFTCPLITSQTFYYAVTGGNAWGISVNGYGF